MLFNSLSFAWFLVLSFGLYWWMGRWKKGLLSQNVFLLLASYAFYGAWDIRFLGLIFLSSLTDFLCGLAMAGKATRAERKPYLWISLAVNLGMLATFKYLDFFAGSLQDLLALAGLQADLPTLELILPVGISFYTFQTLSYTLDVYRGDLEATRKPIQFFAFVAFFPQLVAGPIERASRLLPQFDQARTFERDTAVSGLRLLLWGIFKKVVIADRMGEYANQILENTELYGTGSLLLGVVFFGIQIYGDFSGYSDIAIGTARLFGFRLSLNFQTPYFSKSVREFWNRWHITLNTWFRDYVYFPLGGNRKGPNRMLLNVALVFLISGLWHGAAYGFLIWALIHALWYVTEKKTGLGDWFYSGPLAGWLGNLSTLAGVFLAYAFFRLPRYEDWSGYFGQLWAPGNRSWLFDFESQLNAAFSDRVEGLFLLCLTVGFFLLERFMGQRDFSDWADTLPRPARWSLYYALVAVLLLFGAYGTPQRFIYFQF